MAYAQGFTNVQNILADFVTTVCFDDKAVEKYENWELIYPIIDNKDDAHKWITNNRRATISSTFMPKNEWQNNEVFKINQDYLNAFSDEIIIKEQIVITKEDLNKQLGNILSIPLTRTVINPKEFKCTIDEILDETLIPPKPLSLLYNIDNAILNLLEFGINSKDKQLYLLKDNFSFINNESFTINIEYYTNPIFEIPLIKTMYNAEAIKLKIKGHKGVFYNNENLNSLNIMEFHPDIKRKKLILLKESIKLEKNEEFVFLITYQSYATNPVTWYADFSYPTESQEGRPNYNYFEWTFGNTIDEEFHVINKKIEPPVMRCFWHTTNKLKIQAADWLPIEYFISWDDTAISFVMCEDPIGDIDMILHAFNYIGILDSIENADYDDIESNFGSCGSYDITSQPPFGTISEILGTIKANITFIERHYDSYFDQVEEHTLLKLNNVSYGNYSAATDIIGDRNLLQPMMQQYTIGDPTIPYSTPSPIKNSFYGQPIERYNVFKKDNITNFTIPSQTIVINPLNINYVEMRLAEDCLVEIANGSPLLIPQYNARIVLITPSISVINILTGLSDTLLAGTKILLENDIPTVFNSGNLFDLPIGTSFITEDNIRYKTTSIIQVYTDKVIFLTGSSFTTKNEVKVYIPDPNLVITETIIAAGNNIELITNYIQADFYHVEEYIVEFQYRDPFRGEMHYDFPTKWFDDLTIRSKSFTDFSGSTPLPSPLPLPIISEQMIPNSNFEHEEYINDTIYESFKNKNPVINRMSFVRTTNNDYHKNTVKVPKTITNAETGESWALVDTKVINGIEHTKDSITNICLYPRQVYVGNFCYNKRTPKKCTVQLDGIMDPDLLRFVLVDKNNTVLVNFGQSGTYKNLSVEYNADNGITLELDMNGDLPDESIYLKVYKKSNYLIIGSGLSIQSVNKPGGCSCTNIKTLNPGDPGYPDRPGEGSRFTIYGPDPNRNNELSWASDHSAGGCGFVTVISRIEEIYPIDVKLFYNYLNGNNEFITHLENTRTRWTSTVQSSTLWSYPAHARIYASELLQQALDRGIVQPLNPNLDIYHPQLPMNILDIPKKGDTITGITYLEIKLNDMDRAFLPKILHINNTTHNWV